MVLARLRAARLLILVPVFICVVLLWNALFSGRSGWTPQNYVPSDVRTRFLQKFDPATQPARKAQVSSDPIASIPIDGNLPIIDPDGPHIPDFAREWAMALLELQEAAKSALDSRFPERDLQNLQGFPGSSIKTKTEAKQLQKHLDCVASKGRWVYDDTGSRLPASLAGVTVHKQSSNLAACDKKYYKGRDARDSSVEWDVRQSLKYRWEADPSCAEGLPDHVSFDPNHPLPSRQDFCRLLSRKFILMTGDITQYLIHDLLLDWTLDAPTTCFGDLYCFEHAICPAAGLAQHKFEGWDKDGIAFKRLPVPPAHLRNHNHPERIEVDQDALPTMLRYRRNDRFDVQSLVSAIDPVFIHPHTGVREFNNFITPDLRRADLLLFSQAPLPLPEATSPNGRAIVSLESGKWQGERKAIELLHLAVRLIKGPWMREMMRSLYISQVQVNAGGLAVWRGGWRMQHECAGSEEETPETWDSPGDGLPPLPRAPSLQQLLFKAPSKKTGELVDIDTLFYNLQTILQNHLLRQFILPRVGVPFLDLETPMSVWRTGMVGSSAYDPSNNGSRISSPGSRNCLLPCLPSAGMSVEEAFIGGLHRVLNWAWDKEPQLWTGPLGRVIRQQDGNEYTQHKKNMGRSAATGNGKDKKG